MALAKSQRSLKAWSKQKWRTKSGKPSSKTGERYLPEKAIKALTKLLGMISGLIAILEMLYLFLLSKCVLNEENTSQSDDNHRGVGTAGSGTGGGGDT